MKLKTRLMLFTAATALSANMAFAAVNPQALAAAYVAEGYTYVEVKVGPTQTKLEAVKGDRKVEVIYDNASGTVIKQEFEDADDDYVGRTGVEIEDADDDFEDAQDDENDDDDGESDDDESDDDDTDDSEDDDGGDDENDDDQSDDDNDDDENDSDSDEDDDDEGGSDNNDDDDGEDGGED
jgi:hypothetical protein